MIDELLPETAKYWMSEMRPSRAALGAATSLIVGACMYGSARLLPDPGQSLFRGALLLQLMILLCYGTARAASAITSERAERTRDLQRLTPLSSGQLVLGKFMGAPVFPLFLALTLLPWAVLGCLFSAAVPVRLLLRDYAMLSAAAFLWLSLGLLVSAYGDTSIAGASSGAAGALMGFVGIQCAFPLILRPTVHAIDYFGAHLSGALFYTVSGLAFGLWAFFAAKWRVGADLLEPPRFWRLPAFLIFLWVYQAGFSTGYAALILPFFFCYFAGVLKPEGIEHWKKWLKGGYPRRLDHTPAWLVAAGTCLILAAGVTAFGGGAADEWIGLARRYPLIQLFFVIRDLAFLQLCRLTRAKRPELMALVYIGLAYALPGIVLLSMRSTVPAPLFYPVPGKDWSALTNLLPGALQAVFMLGLLAAKLRRISAREA